MERFRSCTRLSALGLLLSALALARPAAADLEHTQLPYTGGHGLGSENTVLTIQNAGNESGCVAWNGTADVVGSSACPAGLATPIAGGDEKTGTNQTQTRTLLELDISRAQAIRVIFNGSQTGNGGITIENLVLTIYRASDGTVLWDSGDLLGRPIVFTETGGGLGKTGDVFDLNAAQITSLNASGALSDPNNRVGIAMSCSGANNGPETVFVASACPLITISPTDLPVGTAGVAYGPITLTASGGVAPYTFTLESGSFPTGINFTDNGGNPGSATISGTTTLAGNYPITILATDANGCEALLVDTLVIQPRTCAGVSITLSPTGGTIPNALETAPYSQTFTASGGSGPYTFSITSGSIPPQLSLSSTGVLSGTLDPNTFGEYRFAVEAVDVNGCSGEEDYTLNVDPVGFPTAVPTLSEWALIFLGLGLVGAGIKALLPRA